MCGRRKMEREYPELCNWGDMPKEMVYEISKQVPKGIVVQFHNNGEPTLFPDLGWALDLFKDNIRCFNTNGKLLLERTEEIIGNLETLTISVVQNDPEQEEQYEIIKKFTHRSRCRLNGDLPQLIFRLLGKVDKRRWEKLPGTIVERILHSPLGSREYTKSPTIPEIGICLDLLTHLAIDRFGKVSHCVRFDPYGLGVIGDVSQETIEEIWNGELRRAILEKHIRGQRNEVGLCQSCEYWGVPRGE